jgi:hypothetical protein
MLGSTSYSEKRKSGSICLVYLVGYSSFKYWYFRRENVLLDCWNKVIDNGKITGI